MPEQREKEDYRREVIKLSHDVNILKAMVREAYRANGEIKIMCMRMHRDRKVIVRAWRKLKITTVRSQNMLMLKFIMASGGTTIAVAGALAAIGKIMHKW